jgi:hypothetical protein
MDVELAGRRAPVESESVRDSLERQRRDAVRDSLLGERSTNESDVPPGLFRADERDGPPRHSEQRGPDARRGRKTPRRDPANEHELEPRPPGDSQERAGPDGGPLSRETPLDDDIAPCERRSWIVEQPTKDRRRSIERDVSDDAKRLLRQRYAQDVTVHHSDVVEPRPHGSAEYGIELDRDHPIGPPRKLGRQTAVAGPDLDDEFFAAELELADDLGSESTTAQKVLLCLPPRRACAPDGHGTSPSS